jgi:ABC-type sugar transport system ATPase subunit
MVTEDRLRQGIIHKLSVRNNMTISCLNQLCKLNFINFKKEIAACDQMINAINIKVADIDQEVGMLSGGNQQKVIIGKWLLTSPDLLILDEPTRGIDVGAKAEIYKLIGNLAKQGKAVIVVSSELPEIMGICDRILVIRGGKIVAEEYRSSFDQEVLIKYAFGIK